MKKSITFILSLVFVFSSIKIAFANENEPSVYADGAILMDYKTGRVLYEKNADKELAMASTTKIMTLIIALENGNLNDTVIVSKNASRAPDVQLDLVEGEEILLGELLYPLMLESSNDCAIAVAEHIGGSVEEFCLMMTKKAEELGCVSTVFETPNGLDKGEHHSTARDMAIITRYALGNEKFVEYINTDSKTFKTNKKTYTVNNKNRLLTTYDGANGVKTGFTNKAGQCFVGSAKRNDMQLISVVLASGWGNAGKERKWTDTYKLLDYGFDNYKYVDIVKQGGFVANVPVTISKTTELSLSYDQDVTLPLNEEEINTLIIKNKIETQYEAPIEKDMIIGTADIVANGETLKTIGIITNNEATRHDFNTKINQIINYWLIL